MPAVQLAQLKRQTDKLIWHFTRPQDFVKALHELLEFYSNRGVYRPGITIQPTRQLNTYYTSSIIIREIEKELKRQTAENPDAALTLADALWHENYTELCTLASFLLGLVPVQSSNAVLDRIKNWIKSGEQAYALSDLLELGTIRLRRETPQIYLDTIRDWLTSSSISINKIGINAMMALVKDEQFHDLPKVYTLTAPMVRHILPPLQGELRQLVLTLINRSPSETAYFLRQVVLLSPNADTKRLLRKVMDELPDHLRSKLRDLVNNPDFTL
jgi:hypothetical protein